jgi:DNA-binding transcriptional ArsR family regulator
MQDALRKFKAAFFQGLSHPTRIAILECLRDGELSTGTLVERLKLEQANASQHLAILRNRNVVSSRREGNQIFYSVRDPRILDVLDIMRDYFQSHLKKEMAALRTIRSQVSG